MDKLSILSIFGLQAVLILMSVITLKSKLNGLEEQIKGNTVHIDGQAEKVIANLEEVAQFEEKALGQLAENIKVVDIGVNKIRERDFTLGQDIGKLENNTKMIKDAVTKSMLCLERQIDASKEEINKIIKNESAKNIAMHLTKF